ncbi:MAG: hypothetical protein V4664_03980 [Patescibacteria group bacterium]
MLQIQEWETWHGTFYGVHLPRVFNFECEDAQLFKRYFNWSLLLDRKGPCADGHGSHNFFGTDAQAREVLESPDGFAIRVREDRDAYGNWRDAVYEVKPGEQPHTWIARLLLVNKSHPDDLRRRDVHHFHFELKELSGNKLKVLQRIRNEAREGQTIEEVLTLFGENDPSVRRWLRE